MTESRTTRKVLILTGDSIGRKLAGPGIRAWHMAHALHGVSDVRLVSYSTVEAVDAPFPVEALVKGDRAGFAELERWADIIVFQGAGMAVWPDLADSDKIIVCDAYVPMQLENLEFDAEFDLTTAERRHAHLSYWMNRTLERADFFLAASERQRMFWLGALTAIGRVNPHTYRSDLSLRALIDVVPFGLSAEPPMHERQVLKGIHPSIAKDDKVLLWSGGLYNWFDPFTLIQAVAELSKRRPDVKLFFLGTKHPNPEVPEMEVVSRARASAEELGVAGTNVIFNESWVDYADRQNYLLEADLGVSTHPVHVETMFSFRTRILDYLWAGLPMVVTEGDHFADLVVAEGLGEAVPEMDPLALAAAIERVVYEDATHQAASANARRVAQRYEWSVALAPLVRFVIEPRRAADRPSRNSRLGRPRHWSRLEGIRSALRSGGVGALARRALLRIGGGRGRAERRAAGRSR